MRAPKDVGAKSDRSFNMHNGQSGKAADKMHPVRERGTHPAKRSPNMHAYARQQPKHTEKTTKTGTHAVEGPTTCAHILS
mmetsp:Transcript_112786/g.318879  ORF Transcript_112786/g.318879 Transcript_112786/m.318879 type:complete len:80 (+) Transcript_112786:857-1096(+)